MFTLKIENIKHNILELTQIESDYQVIGITGLNPPNAQINRSTVAGLDGTKFNSSKLGERNVVITLKLNGDVEANRINLYRYFNTKQWCKIYYKNENRDVYIEGYVETCELNLFTNNETMQISIICPNPYFKSIKEISDDISKVIAMFEFPFDIDSNGIEFSTIDTLKITNVYNNSESETGAIIEIDILGECNKIQIKNITSGGTFTIKYNFLEDDRIIIDTNKGNKSVSLIRNAQTINLFSNLENNSTFFQLEIGDNYFSYLIDDGINDDGVRIIFKHYTLYGGV